MAKSFVKVTLATKVRVVYATAVVVIIAAALAMPWYFMEQMAAQDVQGMAAELARLRLNEWENVPEQGDQRHTRDQDSIHVRDYTNSGRAESRRGPLMVTLSSDYLPSIPLDSHGRAALKAFVKNPRLNIVTREYEDEFGKTGYRCFRAVRFTQSCNDCHKKLDTPLQYQVGQLKAIVDMTIPSSSSYGSLAIWTRVAFIVGGVVAATLAVIVFAITTQRLILRPLRKLRVLTDKVADGDLSVRSSVKTGDELQRLGDSFNQMLDAIADQHSKLQSANRALDLRLHELADANVTLSQANQVKTEFLTNISHELRTPLNSIIGFADLVCQAEDERFRRYGQNIGTAARNLLGMINDMLDLAKIEAGKAEVRWDKVSVTDTCQTMISLMKPLADKKQIELVESYAENTPLIVSDAGKLQQILYNLISNAVKFTPIGGKVTVSTELHGHTGDNGAAGEVAVSVADTGPGIAEADQQRIFEKFYQADRSLTKGTSGTGLGLAISRELANLLCGRLVLKSEPGHGATFTMILPVSPPQAPVAPAAAQEPTAEK